MTTYLALSKALGWAVLHSLWQIALLWVLFKIAARIFRHRHERVYLASLAAMAAAAVCFAATFLQTFENLAPVVNAPAETGLNAVLPSVTAMPTMDAMPSDTPFLLTARAWLEENSIRIGWAWGFCVALLWLRMIGAWWLAQRLRSRNVSAPRRAFAELCGSLSDKLKIKKLVRLLESPHVREPLTLGFLKPVILFPAGMLLQLSTPQVEALLLHELAHIRRYDYLVNLVQLTLETCFFYHPLFWLISREARVQREFCCDDVVLRHTNDPILYAKTLTDLQISIFHPTTQFAMTATGKSRFSERIWRIAGIYPKRDRRPNWLSILLLPAFAALCSWWPTNAAPLVSPVPESISVEQIPQDTVPPARAGQAKDREQSATSGDDAAAGQHTVAIEPVKMNVFYIGVDNPLRVAVSGVPASELDVVLIGNGSVTGKNGRYVVQVTTPGTVKIQVSRVQKRSVTLLSTQEYRVKRIPDPRATVGGRFKGGVITKEGFLSSDKVVAMLENFDFDVACEVVGYSITILPHKSDPIVFNVIGGVMPKRAREVIAGLSGDGDAIFIDDVLVKCPGDSAPRNLGGMAYKLMNE